MFWKDGKPFQIIGGDLHYFRVLPEVFISFISISIVYLYSYLSISILMR